MLYLLSPAKSLDYDTPVKIRKFTQPDFLDESARLIDQRVALRQPSIEFWNAWCAGL